MHSVYIVIILQSIVLDGKPDLKSILLNSSLLDASC